MATNSLSSIIIHVASVLEIQVHSTDAVAALKTDLLIVLLVDSGQYNVMCSQSFLLAYVMCICSYDMAIIPLLRPLLHG